MIYPIAYIGPGAGFAFLGSFLAILLSVVLTATSVLIWPFRAAWHFFTCLRSRRKAKARKLIFLGLDGLDPGLTEKFMAEGKLPNLSRLMQQGGFRRLRTTFPALSPVAWSTFATGVNPARHNIFDFLNRDLKSYLPELSSSKVSGAKKFWQVGRYRIPLEQASVELRQRQVEAVRYLDCVVEELFDLVPRNTYITITSDHGELFGEEGYFGHGPIQHDKVFEVFLVEGKLR